MAISYGWGLFCASLGWLLLLLEAVYEDLLVRGSYILQVMCALSVFGVAACFYSGVVIVYAPLNVESYAMRKGEYARGTRLPGISWAWDPHLTDLRAFVTNSTDDDYSELDLEIQPDTWNYRATIVDEPNSGCQLSSLGGTTLNMVRSAKGGPMTITGHRIGNGFEVTDTQGNTWERFLTAGGYRLRCATLPAHFTVQIAFALASEKSALLENVIPPAPKPSEFNMRTSEFSSDDPSDTEFDLLGKKPWPSTLSVIGHYKRGLKPFKYARTIGVGDG